MNYESRIMERIPFSTYIAENGDILVKKNCPIKFVYGRLFEFLLYISSGFAIVKASLSTEKPFEGNEKKIIQQIHKERFDPRNAYVITGGHFHQLYVRNLGIFYNALLDSRIQLDIDDWENRQRVALQTLTLDLEVFRQAGKIYTTIVPFKNNMYSAMNVRTIPSDSLFGMLYTFCALIDPHFIEILFSVKKTRKKYTLQTITAGKKLLAEYKNDLTLLIQKYKDSIFNKKIKLIKTSLYLASSLDGLKRESSFYDNVIMWSTCRLAKKLGLLSISEKELNDWKGHIISVFWDEKEGIFLDDISSFAKKTSLFSADAFIVISTQFLQPKILRERNMLISLVSYVKKHNMDQPFPLQAFRENYKHRMYATIKYFVPEYMGKGIWSHWGMEYTKLLILLSAYVPSYRKDAERYIELYKKNIEKYGGYPELYDPNGKLYNKPGIYKTVLHNGWVINYEQAKMMLDTVI